jgi:hypothetical protein
MPDRLRRKTHHSGAAVGPTIKTTGPLGALQILQRNKVLGTGHQVPGSPMGHAQTTGAKGSKPSCMSPMGLSEAKGMGAIGHS